MPINCIVHILHFYINYTPYKLQRKNVSILAGAISYLEWIPLGDDAQTLPETDDGTSEAIAIPQPGFPFWDSVQTQVYVWLLLQ